MDESLKRRLRDRGESWRVWIDDGLPMERGYSVDNMRYHRDLDINAADRIEELERANAEVEQAKEAAVALAQRYRQRLDDAERATIERCAQVAFDQQSDDPQPGGWNECAQHIAAAIAAEHSRLG